MSSTATATTRPTFTVADAAAMIERWARRNGGDVFAYPTHLEARLVRRLEAANGLALCPDGWGGRIWHHICHGWA